MKKNLVTVMLMLMFLAIASPTISLASDPEGYSISSREAEANRLKDRLKEIHAMDTKSLSKSEKKALRTEVRAIKKELAAVSGGVYLSVGALIIIALLLILLL